MLDIPKDKKLIIFDGVCNLCIASVQYVIKHDKKNSFLFTALQSNTGLALIKKHTIDTTKIDSLLLYSETDGISSKSTAALKIAYNLGFPNSLMAVFFIIPRFIRDWVYDYIAKNRYQWFGKKQSCIVPTPELMRKFLE